MKANVNGIRVHYRMSGKEGAPVVMLSHSLCTTSEMWSQQVKILEEQFRVLCYDTRGHGGSDAPPEAYRLEQLAEDATGLMTALDIEAVHWVGISMGGMIGQSLGLGHPDRIRSLVLCDTAAVMTEEVQPVWQQRIDIARKKGMEALAQETLERWFTPPYLAQNPPAVQAIKKQILATPVAGFVGCSEAIRRLDYLDRLCEIEHPTLIIVGEQDPGTPVSASQAIQARIAGSRLEVIPDAAHLCNVQQAEAFNAVLLEFLSKQ